MEMEQFFFSLLEMIRFEHLILEYKFVLKYWKIDYYNELKNLKMLTMEF